MLETRNEQSNAATAPQSLVEQACTIQNLPEGREEFNKKFQPLFQRILLMPGGKVRFGENDSYFIELPGGNNPYAYYYEDNLAFARIWQNVILAEHGWPLVDVLERMLFEDAEYEERVHGVPYGREHLEEHEQAHFNKAYQIIRCQLNGHIYNSDPQVLFFTIDDKYDSRPPKNLRSCHMVPYTKDGEIWLWSLARLGLSLRTDLAKNTGNRVNERKRREFAKTMSDRLETLQKASIIKNYIEANNGVDILFERCSERLFFKYDSVGILDLNHLARKVQEFLNSSKARGATTKVIDRKVVREWFICDLIPLAKQADLKLSIKNDRKYLLLTENGSRCQSFTLANYCKVWRTLNNVIYKK